MRPDDLRELLRQQPFHPFTSYVLDGTAIEIRHLELAAVMRSTVHLGGTGTDSDSTAPNRLTILALLHITRFEMSFPSGSGANQ